MIDSGIIGLENVDMENLNMRNTDAEILDTGIDMEEHRREKPR